MAHGYHAGLCGTGCKQVKRSVNLRIPPWQGTNTDKNQKPHCIAIQKVHHMLLSIFAYVFKEGTKITRQRPCNKRYSAAILSLFWSGFPKPPSGYRQSLGGSSLSQRLLHYNESITVQIRHSLWNASCSKKRQFFKSVRFSWAGGGCPYGQQAA